MPLIEHPGSDDFDFSVVVQCERSIFHENMVNFTNNNLHIFLFYEILYFYIEKRYFEWNTNISLLICQSTIEYLSLRSQGAYKLQGPRTGRLSTFKLWGWGVCGQQTNFFPHGYWPTFLLKVRFLTSIRNYS